MTVTQYNPDKPLEAGIIVGEPNEVYHDNPAESKSTIAEYKKSPANYKAKKNGLIEIKQTDAMFLGELLHCFVLERCEFFERYHVFKCDNPGERSVKAYLSGSNTQKLEITEKCKNYLAELEKNKDKKPVTQDQFDKVVGMERGLMENKLINELISEGLENGYTEITLRTPILKQFGFSLQCRYDLLNLNGCKATNGKPYAIDLKKIGRELYSSSAKTEYVISKSMNDFDYFMQDAVYSIISNTLLDIGEKVDFYFAFVEDSQPHKAQCVKIAEESLVDEMESTVTILNKMAESKKTGIYSPVETDLITIEAPRYRN